MKHGIFVTDYIECDRCRELVMDAIQNKCQSLELVQLSKDEKFIAAKATTNHPDYAETEIGEVQSVLAPILERQLCCVVRIMVMSANFELCMFISPMSEEELNNEEGMKVVGEGKTGEVTGE